MTLALRSLFVLGAAAALVAAVVTAVRFSGSSTPDAREVDGVGPTPPSHAPDDMTLLGWAHPIGGHRGKHGPGVFTHEINLEDGRTFRFTTHKLFGGGQCVKVRLRGTGRAATVVDIDKPDEPCPDRGPRRW